MRKAAAKPRSRSAKASREPIQIRTLTAASVPWAMLEASAITPETAVRVTSILAVTRWISQAVAVMPWHIMRELSDGRREKADLPGAYVIRRRPNAWQPAYDFWQLVAYWVALHGNAYARILPGPRGWLSELRPMHPARVRVFRDYDYAVWYEFWNADGKWERLRADEVLHWRWLSDNGLVGLPPVELCGTSIALARKLDQAAAAYWDNSGRPDMVIETDEKIPDEAMHILRQSMQDMYGGPRNRGKAAVLPKKTRIKPIEQNTMEQSQFQELRDAILPEVCRCWGVPSTMLGDHRMARFSNVEQEHLSAQVWCLLPWQRRMEGPVDMALQHGYQDETIYSKLDNRGLLRADTASRVALYQGLWNMGAISPNELRDLEDLPLLETPSADQTYVQLGFSTLDAAAAQASSHAEPEEDAAEEPAEAEQAPADAGVILQVLAQVTSGAVTPEAAVVIILAAFPEMEEEKAREMVAGAAPPPEEEPAAEEPEAEPAEENEEPEAEAEKDSEEDPAEEEDEPEEPTDG